MRQFLETAAYFSVVIHGAAFPKQDGNTPKTGQANQCVDNAAEQAALSAEQPCNQVKLKNAHQTPV